MEGVSVERLVRSGVSGRGGRALGPARCGGRGAIARDRAGKARRGGDDQAHVDRERGREESADGCDEGDERREGGAELGGNERDGGGGREDAHGFIEVSLTIQ